MNSLDRKLENSYKKFLYACEQSSEGKMDWEKSPLKKEIKQNFNNFYLQLKYIARLNEKIIINNFSNEAHKNVTRKAELLKKIVFNPFNHDPKIKGYPKFKWDTYEGELSI